MFGAGVKFVRMIDLPPVWFGLFLAASWAGRGAFPAAIAGPARWAGLGFAVAGGVLAAWAIFTILSARTTVHPHGTPSRLVSHGPFARSRNPIYLADLMLLIAGALWWGSVFGLLLCAVFVPLISRRFIAREELGLRRLFGRDAQAYMERVRRWV